MSTIAAALAAARTKLPASEARLLMGHAIDRPAAWLLAHDDEALGEDAMLTFASLVARRSGGEPVAYLVGYREFFGRRFIVAPGVLIPRPETELLVELAVTRFVSAGAPRILDLGTGSGCIAVTLALELPRAQVAAADHSGSALALAAENARRLGASVDMVQSDWFAALGRATYDLIVSNPPYVCSADPHLGQGDLRYEPIDALASGPDGLDAIRKILRGSCHHLGPEGVLLLEHGYDQGDMVRDLMLGAGFRSVEQHKDLAGIVRATSGLFSSACADLGEPR